MLSSFTLKQLFYHIKRELCEFGYLFNISNTVFPKFDSNLFSSLISIIFHYLAHHINTLLAYSEKEALKSHYAVLPSKSFLTSSRGRDVILAIC